MSLRASVTRQKCVVSLPDCELYACTTADGATPLWLKVGRTPGPGAGENTAVRAEIELLGALAGPGVPRVADAETDGPEPALLLEALPGAPLSTRLAEGALDVATWLDLAILLARILARVHAARIVHLGLVPDRIWLDPQGPEIALVDFSTARRVGAANVIDAGPGDGSHPDTLRYRSPEQTGRMGVGADSRSDLYSIGACLYHAATGRPPFEEDDPLALVHAHIARNPTPMLEVQPDFPPTLARIVTKLLQKSQEARYQTAAALERDLAECRQQLERHGAVDDELMLGTADAPYRPLFPKQLYGREREVEALSEACAASFSGSSAVVLLRGVAGIGKSALVYGLRKPVAVRGGYFASGKFDLYRRDLPYSAVSDALGNVMHQLLTEPEERLAAWREALRTALGTIGGALVGVVPALDLVVPDLPPVAPLGPSQTLARLALAVQRLLCALASDAHPLALFIDDLQWADASSRALLRGVLRDEPVPYLLLIGAYREEEVEPGHPLTRLIDLIEAGPVRTQSLALGPLDTPACAQMLASALGRSPDDTLGLAREIGRKTANNPLLVQQFVAHMYDLGEIHFVADVGWSWDVERIAASAVAEGAVQLLAARIARLPANAQPTLELAACVGDEFDLEMLAALSDHPRSELESALFVLCDEGLLAPAPTGFRFVHDRIREAAQQRLRPERRVALHHRAASLLLERLPEGEHEAHAFEIADHLNLGADCVPPQQREVHLRMNELAGERALRSGAASTALRYYEVALDLAGRPDVEPDPARTVRLRFQAAEAAAQANDLDRADALLTALAGSALDRLPAAQVAAKQIQVAILRNRDSPGEVIGLVLESLRRLGVAWPARPSPWQLRLAVWHTDWALRGALDERAFHPVRHDPSSWLAPALVLGAGAVPIQAQCAAGVALLSGYVARLYRRHGYATSPGSALAGYAAFRRIAVGHLRGMERYADAALAWGERVFDPVMSMRTRFIVYAYVHCWTRPRRELSEPLREVYETARELGDVEYALYVAAQRANLLALSGTALAATQSELRTLASRAARDDPNPYSFYADLVDFLTEQLPGPGEIDAARQALGQLLRDAPATRMTAWGFWMLVLCVLGRFDETWRFSEAIGSWTFEVGAASSQLADYVFLRGLAAVALPPRARERRLRRRALRHSLRWLRIWSRDGPDFVHMRRALEAERARLAGRSAAALRGLRYAADRAERIGYHHHAGLLREREAALLDAQHRQAERRAALKRAARCYNAWGAHAKARSLAQPGDHPERELPTSGATDLGRPGPARGR